MTHDVRRDIMIMNVLAEPREAVSFKIQIRPLGRTVFGVWALLGFRLVEFYISGFDLGLCWRVLIWDFS